ncbi:MAG: FG-GAP-like repeat-containing protein, partial [Myxococcota bacterium]
MARHASLLLATLLLLPVGCGNTELTGPTAEEISSAAALYREEFPPPSIDLEAPEPPAADWATPLERPDLPPPPEDPDPIDFLPPVGSNTPVGTLPGDHQMSPTGGLSYSIPLSVPPGFRGLEPQLSLTYRSGSGSGIAGRGFHLDGLSRLHRCSRLKVGDLLLPRVRRASKDDGLCLDGVPLVLVSGNYGENGSTYYLESDEGTTLQANGTCQDFDTPNPLRPDRSQALGSACHFEAKLRDGTVMTYGSFSGPECARVHPISSSDVYAPRIEWPLTKVVDRGGNRMNIQYTPAIDEDDAQTIDARRCLPDRISYGGNLSLARDHDRHVEFDYTSFDHEGRSTAFLGGVRRSRNLFLRHVRTLVGPEVGGAAVKRYDVVYNHDEPSTAHDGWEPPREAPRVREIAECDDTGACFPPTRFEFWPSALSDDYRSRSVSEMTSYRGAPSPSNDIVVQGDFNGDGRSDFVTQLDAAVMDNFVQYLSPAVSAPFEWNLTFLSSPFTTAEANWDSESLSKGVQAGDFNGDGYDDLLMVRPQGFFLYLGGESGLPSTPSITDASIQIAWSVASFVAGDFDRDSQDDLLRITTGRDMQLFQFDGSTFTPTPSSTAVRVGSIPDFDVREPNSLMAVRTRVGDFDGDGRPDILFFRRVFLNGTETDPSDYGSTDI